MGQANCASQISDKQKGKQDFLLMSYHSFLLIMETKEGWKSTHSQHVVHVQVVVWTNVHHYNYQKIKSNWSESPSHLLENLGSKPQVMPSFWDAQRGDPCTVLLGDCVGTTPWKTQDPRNHCKFQKSHYWWVCKRLKPVFIKMCSTGLVWNVWYETIFLGSLLYSAVII